MSVFCFDCIEQITPATTLTSIVISGGSALIALYALQIAQKNLKSVKNSHALQAQMNLITLEKDVRQGSAHFLEANRNFNLAIKNAHKNGIADHIYFEYNKSFNNYVASSDKLAAIILSGNLDVHFPNRDWKKEYESIFEQTKFIYDSDTIIKNKNEKISNLEELLTQDVWQK